MKKLSEKYVFLLKENGCYGPTVELFLKTPGWKKKYPLLMKNFDYELIVTLAKDAVKPLMNKEGRSYGSDKKEAYLINMAILDLTISTCKLNAWLEREEWVKKGVPMNKIFKDLMIAVGEYGGIKRYYETNRLKKLQAEI